jgi:hypothetical protein
MQPMLGHGGHSRGDIRDLTAHHPHRRSGIRSITATGTADRNMIDDLAGLFDQFQRKPLDPRLFPGRHPVLRRSDRGGAACSGPSEDGGFDEFREF